MMTEADINLVRVTAANTLRNAGHPTLAGLVERCAQELRLFQPESTWDPELSEADKIKLITERESLRVMAQELKTKLPHGWGFTLVLFEYGEKGVMTYLSSAHRGDTVKLLEELIGKIKREMV